MTCRRTIPTMCAAFASTAPTTGLRSLPTSAGRSAPISIASWSSAASLFRAFEYALDLEEGYFTSKFTKPLARLRVCYYEPQPEPHDIAHIGLGAHTDYECFTTVWQDREGLQMLSRDGEWLILPPVEGSFAVNLGDLMQQWTNDMFVSTMHRVINTSGSKRYSLVQFFGVDYEVEVEAIPGCVGPGSPWRYEPIKAGDHSERMVARTYRYDE